MYLLLYNFAKCFANRIISFPRLRKGGIVISTVLMRYIRSFRNLLSLANSAKETFVAQIRRISTGMSSLLPILEICLFCKTFNNLACWCKEILPISSKNKVPPFAISNLPILSSLASVKAPFLCPNNSLSNKDSVKAPTSTFTKGLDALIDC